MIPSTGQYWRLTGEEDPPVEKGDLVLICGFADGKILFAFEDVTYELDPDSFLENYVFEPDGDKVLQRQVEEAMKEVESQSQRDVKLLGEVAEGGVSDLTIANPQTADAAKRRIADVRNRTARVRNKALKAQAMVKKRAQQFETMAHGQERQLAKMADALQGKLKLAEEAIWTVNLYLGRNEEIKRLSKGKPASIEEPVVVRQKRLFMDEECALAAEEGGITAVEFEQFDEWLLKPENLNRVAPEQRCVIAFRPRRMIRKTGDYWQDKHQVERDYKTYFLFRNGGNLFRVCTDLEVDVTLFPRRDKGDDLFVKKTRFNTKSEVHEEEFIKPGTEEYMKAMKAAEGSSRHYMRVFLFLQGIFDRTTIFQPLPGGSVNLLDPRDDTLVFLRDAEDVLEDGHSRFSEWLRDLNSSLKPGHRIMGVFSSYGSYSSRGEGSRIWPESCMDHPDDLEVYTLEAPEGEPNALKFLFTRTNEVAWFDAWGCYMGYRLPKTRASFRVKRSDDFILNIDDAMIEDIDFYLNSFADRVHYIHLFPLLRKALEVKRTEEAEEEPFKKLVMGQLAQKHELAVDQSLQAIVNELIEWWKLKNKVHRALTEDDAKALRMILKEYSRQRKLEEERGDREMISRVCSRLKERCPDVLLIGHVREREFVVLQAMNDENVHVRRLLYRYHSRKDEIHEIDRREWWLVDRGRHRWLVVHSHPRWEEWQFEVDRNRVLTDPEEKELAHWALQELGKRLTDSSDDDDEEDGKKRFLPIAVTCQGFKLEVWYSKSKPQIDVGRLLTGKRSRLELSCTMIKWGKRRGEIFNRFVSHYGQSHVLPHNPFMGVKVVWESKKNQEQFQKEWEEHREADRRRDLLRDFDSAATSSLAKKSRAEWEKRERAEFDADYGDPELWEAHLKSLDEPRVHSDRVSRALSLLIERGIEVSGKTVKEILEDAEPYLRKSRKKETYGGFSREETEELEDSPYLLPEFVVEIDPKEISERDEVPDGSVFRKAKLYQSFDDEDEEDEE